MSDQENQILVIDGAGDTCGIMLVTNGKEYYQKLNSQRLTEEIIPNINQAQKSLKIKLKDINIIGWNQGPGSFTSLRITASIVQGLSTPLNIKVVGFSTFDFLLESLHLENKKILCTIDARSQEVYWGIYQFDKNNSNINNIQIKKEISVDSPQKVINYLKHQKIKIDFVIGNAIDIYSDFKKHGLIPIKIPNHQNQLRAIIKRIKTKQNINAYPPADLPLYVRKKVAKSLDEQTIWHQRITR